MNGKSRKTILLVEDEFLISMTEKMQLEEYGYDVTVVGTGEKAVAAFKNGHAIDLVLMDINLGNGIDGTEAAQLILQDRDVPIVFLSSHTEQEVVEKTENITSYGYVVKSSSITVLDASIKMAFKLFAAHGHIEERENSYRSLFENMLDGYAFCKAIFDDRNRLVDFVYLAVNPAFAQLTGLIDVVGRPVSEVIPGIREASPDLFESYGRVALTGTAEKFETDFRSLGLWLSISVYSPANGYFVAIFEDITKRKRNEEIIRYQANLLEHVSDAIIATDMHYNIQFWNKMAEKQYGWTASEVIGHPMSEFITNDYLGSSLENILQEISQLGYWKGELTQNRRDGVRIPISSTISIIPDDAKQPSGFIAVNREISERKLAEEELARSNEELTRFNLLMAGRELRSIKLKQQVNDLAAQLGQPRLYPLAFLDPAAEEFLRTTSVTPKGDLP